MDGIDRRARITRTRRWGRSQPIDFPGISRRKRFEARVEPLEGRALLAQTLFFAASDGTNGRQLWESDGTKNGTFMFANLNKAGDSNPRNLFVYNGAILFAANDRLWRTDGTSQGTYQLPQAGASSPVDPADFTLVGSTLFFSAWDSYNGRELWKTDGTAAGTKIVDDIYPGYTQGGGLNSSDPSDLINVGGVLYFTATDGVFGRELWKSGGTQATTSRVTDINPNSASAFFDDTDITQSNGGTTNGLALIGSQLFFFANDGAHGDELWTYNTTTNATRMVADIYAGSGSSRSPNIFDTGFPRDIAIGSEYYFEAFNGTTDSLWESNGTSTIMLTTALPTDLTNFNGTLFFAGGIQLWKSNGTAAGTVLVATHPNLGTPGNLTVDGTTLYFSAADTTGNPSSYNFELWKTDGGTNTVLVKDINQQGNGLDGSFPGDFTPFNNELYFSAVYSTPTVYSGRELVISDGTSIGTTLVKDINPGTADAFLGIAGSDHLDPYTQPNYFTVFNVVQPMAVKSRVATDGTASTTAIQTLFSDETVDALATSLALTPLTAPSTEAAAVNPSGAASHKQRVVTMIS